MTYEEANIKYRQFLLGVLISYKLEKEINRILKDYAKYLIGQITE